MNDLISRKALLAEYDRVHIGEPGQARTLIENAPAVDAPHWATEQAYKNGYEAGKRDVYKWKATEDSVPKDFVSVLIYIPSEYPLPMVKEAYLAEGVWVTKTSMFFAKDVTHWMPLPEPPKED